MDLVKEDREAEEEQREELAERYGVELNLGE